MHKQVSPGGTAPPTTNGGNREKCILRAAITYFGVSPAHVFHVLARSSTRHSLRRRPPFFPAICALRIYGRTFVCRPQYMGDVIIVIRGLPPRRTGIGAPLRTGSDISDKAKLFKTSQHTSFPLSQQRHRAAVMLLQRMQSFR